jgi:hypothetical protein
VGISWGVSAVGQATCAGPPALTAGAPCRTIRVDPAALPPLCLAGRVPAMPRHTQAACILTEPAMDSCPHYWGSSHQRSASSREIPHGEETLRRTLSVPPQVRALSVELQGAAVVV